MTRENATLSVFILLLMVLFIGIPTDHGTYFGYFWKIVLFIANL